MHNLGGKSDAPGCQTREGFTKSQIRKQREVWKNRRDLNEENNCKEDDGDDAHEEDDNEIDESGDDKKDDDGGDDGDNEIEEASPNGNKSEKKDGQNRGIGEKRAVC